MKLDDEIPLGDLAAGHDHNDAPDHIRRRRSTTSSNLYRNVSIALIIVITGLYLGVRPHSVIPLASQPDLTVHRTNTGTVAAQPNPSAPVVQRATPQPLADCIKADNVIDESVIQCRYGYHPPPRIDPNAQGMVSAEYMAQLKDSPSPSRTGHSQFTESQRVLQWDGGGSFKANWTVIDNQIDSTSVCANHRRGSIEFRECRKGAKVWFKEQCRRGEEGAAHRRYCSAASSFSPMG